MSNDVQPLLKVRNLAKHFPLIKGSMRRVVGQIRAVDGVSFDLYPGECLGVVGESGSGKTTLARCLLRAMRPTSGEALLRVNGREIDVAAAPEKILKELRPKMQMIFQDPISSLNPRMTVMNILAEPLKINGMKDRPRIEQRVRELLTEVGLDPESLKRYPHAFSGGQRQRIGIARALALRPTLIVADEPVSALDVSVQAQVLNLLQSLRSRMNLTYLFIAHDLGVVRHICDRVAVMYAGKIVELSDVKELFDRPRHPYTEALLSAIPLPDPKQRTQSTLQQDEPASASNLPAGCAFHPRCRYAEPRCQSEAPPLRQIDPGRLARCHLAEQLDLAGASWMFRNAGDD